jgi:uncharacterized protein
VGVRSVASVTTAWWALAILVGFGVASGVTTVLFGFGGGFVTVPVIATVEAGSAGAMHTAVATSTAVMVVNAGLASVAGYRDGRLDRRDLWPLAGWIAVGAALGAAGAVVVPEGVLRVLFAGYLVVTIVDGLARRGFLRAGTSRPLGPGTVSAGGVGIGALAGLLGVGGSVMTVPLLRRRGRTMTAAVSAANPLSLPVAVVATAVYLAAPATGTGTRVDLLAAAALLAGSLPTIPLARRLLPRVPDRAHALAYLALLCAALVAVLA